MKYEVDEYSEWEDQTIHSLGTQYVHIQYPEYDLDLTYEVLEYDNKYHVLEFIEGYMVCDTCRIELDQEPDDELVKLELDYLKEKNRWHTN